MSKKKYIYELRPGFHSKEHSLVHPWEILSQNNEYFQIKGDDGSTINLLKSEMKHQNFFASFFYQDKKEAEKMLWIRVHRYKMARELERVTDTELLKKIAIDLGYESF